MIRAYSSLLFLIISFLICSNIAAQIISQIEPNTISVEIGGFGGVYSLNFERRIIIRSDFGISTQLGIGTLNPNLGNNATFLDVRMPMHFKVFKDFTSKMVEFGFGAVPYNLNNLQDIKKLEIAYAIESGIRWSLLKNRIILGFSVNLFFFDTNETVLTPWGAFKVGYAF